MNIIKAIEIFNRIESEDYSDEEKAIAIYQTMNMPTHMGITKDEMLTVIKWLFDRAFEIEVENKEATLWKSIF